VLHSLIMHLSSMMITPKDDGLRPYSKETR
jgi:hypothetical protein